MWSLQGLANLFSLAKDREYVEKKIKLERWTKSRPELSNMVATGHMWLLTC